MKPKDNSWASPPIVAPISSPKLLVAKGYIFKFVPFNIFSWKYFFIFTYELMSNIRFGYGSLRRKIV